MAQRTESSGQRKEESSRRKEESSRRKEEPSRRKEEPSRRREEPSRIREEKEQLSIPPMRYKLTKLTQAETLTEIAIKTQGFYELSTYSADWIQRDVRSREFSSFGSLLMPRQTNVIDTVIGEDNYYLKLTMKNHNMDYICYDKDNNELQFWGEYQCCVNAMNELRYRLVKIQTRNDNINDKKHYDNKKWQWPVSRYSPKEEQPTERIVDQEIEQLNFEHLQIGPIAAETVLDISYSKIAVEQMNKMGFVQGAGLGATGTGRLTPVNPVEDLGGRPYNNHFGLGFTVPEPVYVPAEPVYVFDSVPAEPLPVTKVITDAEKYGCKCNGDTGICCMSCWRNADA